jgi:glycosyltransferase involved in cell wall biosynthesis
VRAGVRVLRGTEARLKPHAARAASRAWSPYSRLFLRDDGLGWSLTQDMELLRRTALQLGVRVAGRALADHVRDQAVFYASHFDLFLERDVLPRNRLATAYFHGRPGTPGAPEFDRAYAGLRRHAAALARVQVTHDEMRTLVLEAGVPPDRVFSIRIPVDARTFWPDAAARDAARARLGIPASAFAVGSLQKDGIGWGAGLEPKLVKGPDVLVRTLAAVRDCIPELVVVLTGPARGYVKRGLERAQVPFVHREVVGHDRLVDVYRSLDACLVCSRQEGGPKAALEAMATGVPLVSTRVGQAAELVLDGRNGWLAEIDDVEALAGRIAVVHEAPASDLASVVAAARRTAEQNSVEVQLPLWRAFLDGLVRIPA